MTLRVDGDSYPLRQKQSTQCHVSIRLGKRQKNEICPVGVVVCASGTQRKRKKLHELK